MIVLRSHELLAVLDPRHGGELLDVVHLQTGRRVLGRPPFATAPPSSGDLSESAWTASYRGGWQLVAPNAGAACRVGDIDHGFHGSASCSPWEVVTVDASVATLTWHGHGLELTRVVELAGASIHVRVWARALEQAPLVVLEHIALGVELLDPEVEIDLPAGLAYELSETVGPPRPPRDVPRWPDVLLLDGSLERPGRWRLEQPRSRLFAVAELPEGRARIRNPTTGTTVELDWETTWLRHLWVWHEAREYGGPWRGMTELLAIEPTSVPHPLGLATAIEHGQALELGPGETADYELRFTVTTT